MRIDISFLPALAAVFMLAFARIAAMVMLQPDLGEVNVPVRIKLATALLLTMGVLPLHRQAYQVDLQAMAPLLVMGAGEVLVGIRVGGTAPAAASGLRVA